MQVRGNLLVVQRAQRPVILGFFETRSTSAAMVPDFGADLLAALGLSWWLQANFASVPLIELIYVRVVFQG